MKQIDRYLRAIKFFLPKPHQNDILAEISEDIHSQIDDLEAERGRKLNDAEIAAVLKKRGSPNLVAGAYLPQKYLIGPAWYPLYCWVLTLVILLVQVPLFVKMCIRDRREGALGQVGDRPPLPVTHHHIHQHLFSRCLDGGLLLSLRASRRQKKEKCE